MVRGTMPGMKPGTILGHEAVGVLAVDCIPSRFDMAREQGAEVIDFEAEDPPELALGEPAREQPAA